MPVRRKMRGDDVGPLLEISNEITLYARRKNRNEQNASALRFYPHHGRRANGDCGDRTRPQQFFSDQRFAEFRIFRDHRRDGPLSFGRDVRQKNSFNIGIGGRAVGKKQKTRRRSFDQGRQRSSGVNPGYGEIAQGILCFSSGNKCATTNAAMPIPNQHRASTDVRIFGSARQTV